MQWNADQRVNLRIARKSLKEKEYLALDEKVSEVYGQYNLKIADEF